MSQHRTLLYSYWQSLSAEGREQFAGRCGTTVPYMRHIVYGTRSVGGKLSVAIDRETGGRVPVESLSPDIDWAYIRGTSVRKSLSRRAA